MDFRRRCVAAALAAVLAAAGPQATSRPDLDTRRDALLRQPKSFESLERVRRLAADYAAAGEFAAAAQTSNIAMRTALALRDLPLAITIAGQSVALCKAAHDLACLADMTFNRANLDVRAGHVAVALGRLLEAVATFRALHDSAGIVEARFNVADARLMLRDCEGARNDLSEISPGLGELGDSGRLVNAILEARVALCQNDPVHALGAANHARVILPRIDHRNPLFDGNPTTEAEILAGRAAARLGLADQALAAASRAMGSARTPADRFTAALGQASILADLHRLSSAVASIEALGVGITQADVEPALEFHRLAARIEEEANRPAQALREMHALSELEERLYRESVAEAVGDSEASIALAERTAETARLERRRVAERLASEARLGRFRIAAAAALGVLTAAAALLLALRARERRAHRAALSAERAQVVAEVHDTLLQDFAAVALELRGAIARAEPEMAARLERLAAQAGASLAEARRAMAGLLAPPRQESPSLAATLARSIATIPVPETVCLSLDCAPDLPALPRHRAEQVERVLHEAVTNAIRHSRSDRIAVTVRARGRRVEAIVLDHGRGFEVQAAERQTQGGWGLSLMRSRMERIGGRLRVSSSPGRGTVVTATLRA